ncbi:heparin lyase I family protein [Flagellimonas sp.]|uniref:heparin lyase I family protein n=1 Tax=Flagellimonas sp. TaxID=2058762 RepID=UPI003F4A7446
MKYYTPSYLVLLYLIFSILFLTSCSKDTDLLSDLVLLDPEPDPIENPDTNGTDGNEEEDDETTEPPTNGDVANLLLNGTFQNSDEWELINGSTASGGTLTMVANGSIGSDFPNWSAQYPNISPQSLYQTRRYRLTFTARQVSGNDVLQVGQRFVRVFEEQITSDFNTYSFEFNGDGNPAGNDLVFGGRGVGDVFEIQNAILEDVGARVLEGDERQSDEQPPQITFYTDFETDQWGDNGVPEPAGNFWEVDHGLPRTTDHPDSPLKAGRNGTGRALWLGAYNGDPTRNEVGKDNALSFTEHWVGVSIYVENELDRSRIMIQNRLIANGSSKTVNTISLRQGDPGELYFSIPTDVNSVDTRPTNGAGSNTESVFFNYNPGEWIDIVLHYKGAFGANYQGPDTSELARNLGFDPRSDGFIEIWVNGEKLVDHVGTTAYRYAREGQEISGIITPKIGPYWSGSNSPRGDVYYDNYRLWVGPDGTYQDVDPSN